MHIYATLDKTERYECNFTTFFRPANFSQRASGRAILIAMGAVCIAFLYPASYWTLTYVQKLQLKMLEIEYSELHAKKITRETKLLKIKQIEEP
jgi:hypothetical protein